MLTTMALPALPQWTLLFAGLCALLQCVLTVLVIQRRAASGIDLLDGGDAALLRRIRAHGNFSETAPMVLLLLLLLELRGATGWPVVALGGCLLAGRVLHAVSLLQGGPRWSRVAGMVLTLTALSGGGVGCVWMFWR
jgi:uncharacterized protein